MIKGFFYRAIMRLAHRFNWHYAPPIYPDGDTQLWCKWCGFRQTIKRRHYPIKKPLNISEQGLSINSIGATNAFESDRCRIVIIQDFPILYQLVLRTQPIWTKGRFRRSLIRDRLGV